MNDFGEPCFRCGVRPDVDCKHRKGVGQPRIQEKMKTKPAHHTAVHWKLARGYRPKMENKNG